MWKTWKALSEYKSLITLLFGEYYFHFWVKVKYLCNSFFFSIAATISLNKKPVIFLVFFIFHDAQMSITQSMMFHK